VAGFSNPMRLGFAGYLLLTEPLPIWTALKAHGPWALLEAVATKVPLIFTVARSKATGSFWKGKRRPAPSPVPIP